MTPPSIKFHRLFWLGVLAGVCIAIGVGQCQSQSYARVTAPAVAQITPVPEPATYGIFAVVALVAICLTRRRK